MLSEIFKENRIVGVVANSNEAKSSLVLQSLIDLKENNDVRVCCLGIEENLHKYITSKGLEIIHSNEDVLDMKITNSVIYIDEIGDLFSVQSKDKQLNRIKRFFNRIFHLNNFLVFSTAVSGFFNKFVCGIVDAYMVKQIDYDKLVNGTMIKRKIKGISTTSDYRLECDKSDYYVLTEKITEKHKFKYNCDLDSKRDLVNPFNKDENKDEKNKMKEKVNALSIFDK